MVHFMMMTNCELSNGCDVVTMDIEHVGVGGLAKLEKEGVNVQPSSRVIGIIQDKYAQKVSAIWIVHKVLLTSLL